MIANLLPRDVLSGALTSDMTSEASRISRIKGNASDDIKYTLGNPVIYFGTHLFERPLFGATIIDRLVCTEIFLDKKVDEPKKLEAKVIVELEVKEGK